jgi:hypothetical protein
MTLNILFIYVGNSDGIQKNAMSVYLNLLAHTLDQAKNIFISGLHQCIIFQNKFANYNLLIVCV